MILFLLIGVGLGTASKCCSGLNVCAHVLPRGFFSTLAKLGSLETVIALYLSSFPISTSSTSLALTNVIFVGKFCSEHPIFEN